MVRLAGASSADRAVLHLPGTSQSSHHLANSRTAGELAERFHYLRQSGCTYVDDVDDAADYTVMRRAMDVVGMTPPEQLGVYT